MVKKLQQCNFYLHASRTRCTRRLPFIWKRSRSTLHLVITWRICTGKSTGTRGATCCPANRVLSRIAFTYTITVSKRTHLARRTACAGSLRTSRVSAMGAGKFHGNSKNLRHWGIVLWIEKWLLQCQRHENFADLQEIRCYP